MTGKKCLLISRHVYSHLVCLLILRAYILDVYSYLVDEYSRYLSVKKNLEIYLAANLSVLPDKAFIIIILLDCYHFELTCLDLFFLIFCFDTCY